MKILRTASYTDAGNAYQYQLNTSNRNYSGAKLQELKNDKLCFTSSQQTIESIYKHSQGLIGTATNINPELKYIKSLEKHPLMLRFYGYGFKNEKKFSEVKLGLNGDILITFKKDDDIQKILINQPSTDGSYTTSKEGCEDLTVYKKAVEEMLGPRNLRASYFYDSIKAEWRPLIPAR